MFPAFVASPRLSPCLNEAPVLFTVSALSEGTNAVFIAKAHFAGKLAGESEPNLTQKRVGGTIIAGEFAGGISKWP